jgi:hypothetical protein
MIKYYLIVIVSFISLLNCVERIKPELIQPIPLTKDQKIWEESQSEADILLLNEIIDISLVFNNGQHAQINTLREYKLITEKGFNSVQNLFYVLAGQHLQNFNGFVVNEDGTYNQFNTEDLEQIPTTNYPPIIGLESRYRIEFPDLCPGSYIQYQYTQIIDSFWMIPEIKLESTIPAYQRTIRVHKAPHDSINFEAFGNDLEITLSDTLIQFQLSYQLPLQSIPASRTQEFDTPLIRIVPVEISCDDNQLTKYWSWGDVYDWYMQGVNQAASDYSIPDSLDLKSDTKIDRIKFLINWIRDNFRYKASLCNGNPFHPCSITTIIDNQSGDCKDLTTLLFALLNQNDIETRPVLTRIATGEIGKIPTPMVFDHVILMAKVGDDTFWLDPTSQQATEPTLPILLEGRPALLDTVITLPSSTAQDNFAYLDIDNLVTLTLKGDWIEAFNEYLKSDTLLYHLFNKWNWQVKDFPHLEYLSTQEISISVTLYNDPPLIPFFLYGVNCPRTEEINVPFPFIWQVNLRGNIASLSFPDRISPGQVCTKISDFITTLNTLKTD